MRRGPLQEGESVLLIDRRGRRYPAVLRRGALVDMRGGKIPHDDLIDHDEGGTVTSTRGERFLVVRPTLAEYVLEMPRGAQVIYPKDLALILLWADIYPGAVVLEAGTGSGALTMALLRAVGSTGRVISYEVRDDFARRATRNIEQDLGTPANLTMEMRDVYEGIPAQDLDRIVLDVPEPRRVVPHAAAALRPGGVILAYLPTVVQVQQMVEALRASGAFGLIETIEGLVRPWNVDGLSVRPEHRMVAHTGFLVTGRRVQGREAAMPPAAESDSEEEPR
ncbi:MAG: tRNA (adenine-N1)-methyltransferase [Armatimonadetes bacterium]|nr:tRNA (adenine-N1)-methyltransferase [Armatimonadota bacterium]